MTTVNIFIETENGNNGIDVDFSGQVELENAGCEYSYQTYPVCEDIKWDAEAYTPEENDVIAAYLADNALKIELKITARFEKEQAEIEPDYDTADLPF